MDFENWQLGTNNWDITSERVHIDFENWELIKLRIDFENKVLADEIMPQYVYKRVK